MNNRTEYLGKYNKILSDVHSEVGSDYNNLIYPTISKQETVTGLYDSLQINIFRLYFLVGINILIFPLRIIRHLMFLNLISLLLKPIAFPENFTFFRTWLIPRSFKENKIQDDYFRSLPFDLPPSENPIIGFQPTNYKLIWKYILFPKQDIFIIPSALLNNFEIISILLHFIFSQKPIVRNNYILNGKKITAHINVSLLNDFFKMRSFQAFLEKEICRKLIDKKIKKFVYIFENQSWEKVACKVFKKESIPTVGYQSSGFSPVFLNFFPNKQDYKKQYQPDILLTVGEGFKKYLNDNAFYKSKVISFAALRFDHPNKNGKYLVKQTDESLHGRILYAFPVHLDQYQLIIDNLLKNFTETEIEVHLKLHPLALGLQRKLLKILPKNFMILEKFNIENLSKTYDAVFFNDNSFGIESMFYGMKSFEVDLFNNSLDERLFYFHEWKARINLMELSNIKDELVYFKYDKSFNRDKVREYLNYMYTPYNKKYASILSLM